MSSFMCLLRLQMFLCLTRPALSSSGWTLTSKQIIEPAECVGITFSHPLA